MGDIQIKSIRHSPNVPELRILGHDFRPSWRAHGSGGFQLQFMSHDEAKWLTLSVEAWAYPEGKEKRTVPKHIIITLDEATARSVYTYLSSVYGGK